MRDHMARKKPEGNPWGFPGVSEETALLRVYLQWPNNCPLGPISSVPIIIVGTKLSVYEPLLGQS